MNIFQRWRERRRQRRKLRELSNIAKGFSSFDRLQQSGLIEWDRLSRRLYIDQSLALLMMRSADDWQNFINNAFLWQYSKECDRAWAYYFQTEELKAVREYSAKKKLSRADIDRIREARRQEILQSDMQPPKVAAFEFFIVSPPELGKAQEVLTSKDPVGRLTAVGHYDPSSEKMQMALWSEIQPFIQQNTK